MAKGKKSFLYFLNVACCCCLHKYKLKINFTLKITNWIKTYKILNMYYNNNDMRDSSHV